MEDPRSRPVRRALRAWAFAAAVAIAPGCNTGPTLAFTGNWTSQLPPQGPAILFTAMQTGSHISGIVTNAGPLTNQADSITGSATREGISIRFSYPANSADGAPGVLSRWSFNGVFTSATTIEGTVTSEAGVTGSMTITKATGPLPV